MTFELIRRRVDLTGDGTVRTSHACLTAVASCILLWATPSTFIACLTLCAALLLFGAITPMILLHAHKRLAGHPHPSWPPVAMVEWLGAIVLAFGLVCLWARGASRRYVVALCLCGLTYTSWRIGTDSTIASGWLWRRAEARNWLLACNAVQLSRSDDIVALAGLRATWSVPASQTKWLLNGKKKSLVVEWSRKPFDLGYAPALQAATALQLTGAAGSDAKSASEDNGTTR